MGSGNVTTLEVRRRAVVTGTAWAVPTVLAAATLPAYAASFTPACRSTAGSWSVNTGTTIYHNGTERYRAGTTSNGRTAYPTADRWGSVGSGTWPYYTTGWTPGASGWTDLDAAIDAKKVTFTHQMNVPNPGFLSMGDRSTRRVTASPAPAQAITATFTHLVPAGTHTFTFEVQYSALALAIQTLQISAAGAGVSMAPIRRYFGSTSVTNGGNAGLGDYTRVTQESTQTTNVSLTATSSGTITFTYLFSLLQPTGTGNNTDIWVANPVLTGGCTA